jgi:hypothetical protein
MVASLTFSELPQIRIETRMAMGSCLSVRFLVATIRGLCKRILVVLGAPVVFVALLPVVLLLALAYYLAALLQILFLPVRCFLPKYPARDIEPNKPDLRLAKPHHADMSSGSGEEKAQTPA